jgi:hypothetical protein
LGLQHMSLSQTWPALQPQASMLPQPSDCDPQVVVIAPQDWGEQHEFVARSQTCGFVQLPAQSIVPPHPSDTLPHVPVGSWLHVFGVQQAPPTQASWFGQPHPMSPPQPSAMFPQTPPPGHALGVQHVPVARSHSCPPEHPQKTDPPHPLGRLPQVPVGKPLQPVTAVQQVLVVGLHSSPLLQLPHIIEPPQPSETMPHAPVGHVVGAQHDFVRGLQELPPGQVPHEGVVPPQLSG